MARPTKDGLDYFPLDTVLDDNFELIEAKHGITGFGVIIKMYQKAYKEYGYYYPWREREQLLFCKWVNVDINTVNAIIMSALEYGIFDKDRYALGVITSHGMQTRYLEASKRRKHITLFEDLLMINVDIIRVNASNNGQAVELLSYSNPYIKGERKGEIETKGNAPQNDAAAPSVNPFEAFLQTFTTAWNDSGCKPRFEPTTSVNLTRDESEKFAKASARIKDIPRALKAVKNFGGICQSKDHEPDGGNFKLPGFLISGIESYVDEVDPWTRCKIKPPASSIPEKHPSVEVPDSEATRKSIDSVRKEFESAPETNAEEEFLKFAKENPDNPFVKRRLAEMRSETFADDEAFADDVQA